MKFIEKAIIVLVVLVCNTLFFISHKIWLIVMDLALLVFYLLFVMGKLPNRVYPKQEYMDTWESRLSVIGAIIYFAFCTIAIAFPQHIKLFGRIGFGIMFAVTTLVGNIPAFRRAFSDYPEEKYQRNMKISIRCLLVLFSNIVILPYMTYSNKQLKTKEGVEYTLVKDGLDTHETMFVDSLSCFVTISHYSASNSVIYVKYHSIQNFEEITRIDTLPATDYKVGHMESFSTSRFQQK